MQAMQRILAEPFLCLQHLQSPEGKLFNELLEEWRVTEDKRLHESKDIVEIHRAQGALHYIEMFLDLSKTIREYQSGVAKGTRTKITLEEAQHGLARSTS